MCKVSLSYKNYRHTMMCGTTCEAQDSGMNISRIILVKGINRHYWDLLFIPLTKIILLMFIPESWASHTYMYKYE